MLAEIWPEQGGKKNFFAGAWKISEKFRLRFITTLKQKLNLQLENSKLNNNILEKADSWDSY